MKKFVTLLFILICSASIADAQTFLEQIQKKEAGKASVKVSQSKEIDELVNGKIQINKPVTQPTNKQQDTKTSPQDKKDSAQTDKVNTKPVAPIQHEIIVQKPKEEEPRKPETTPKAGEKRQPTESESNSELDIPTVDMRKKVMRKSYKVNGYRVQAYAGGNSRADRQRAEEIRDNIKQKIPDEPIYVHFYSPRWICRIGNYRSYEEAARVLQEIKKMGYKQASIVRGQISVQY